ESVQAKPRVLRPPWPSRAEARARRRTVARSSGRRPSDGPRWYREDGDDVIYTWRARLVAIPVICGLAGLTWLDHLLFDSTRLANVIATVLAVALLYSKWILVVGRMSDE